MTVKQTGTVITEECADGDGDAYTNEFRVEVSDGNVCIHDDCRDSVSMSREVWAELVKIVAQLSK